MERQIYSYIKQSKHKYDLLKIENDYFFMRMIKEFLNVDKKKKYNFAYYNGLHISWDNGIIHFKPIEITKLENGAIMVPSGKIKVWNKERGNYFDQEVYKDTKNIFEVC